jgi:hypothetical protein
MRRYTSVLEIKQAAALGPDKYFFTPGAMRYFNSRISETIYGGRYFVTSERPPSGPRRYTVRRINDDRSIEDVSGFQAYASLSGASAAAERYAREEQNEL